MLSWHTVYPTWQVVDACALSSSQDTLIATKLCSSPANVEEQTKNCQDPQASREKVRPGEDVANLRNYCRNLDSEWLSDRGWSRWHEWKNMIQYPRLTPIVVQNALLQDIATCSSLPMCQKSLQWKFGKGPTPNTFNTKTTWHNLTLAWWLHDSQCPQQLSPPRSIHSDIPSNRTFAKAWLYDALCLSESWKSFKWKHVKTVDNWNRESIGSRNFYDVFPRPALAHGNCGCNVLVVEWPKERPWISRMKLCHRCCYMPWLLRSIAYVNNFPHAGEEAEPLLAECRSKEFEGNCRRVSSEIVSSPPASMFDHDLTVPVCSDT